MLFFIKKYKIPKSFLKNSMRFQKFQSHFLKMTKKALEFKINFSKND